MEKREQIYSIILRYLILLILPLGNLFIIYIIFSPLTIYPVFFLLSLFYQVSLSGITINLAGVNILIVEACVAGSAYYLLYILNLTTPMTTKKRVYSLIFSSLLFLVINILRIFFFSIILMKSFPLFNILHLIFWYLLSGIIVFLVWLVTIKVFKIREIPVYSDIKYLYGMTRKNTNNNPKK